MKKMWYFILMLLIGCSFPSSKSIREKYPPDLDAFEFSKKCANVCWLGIYPGATANDARLLLRASEKIDQNIFHRSETQIETYWFIEKTKTLRSHVFIYFENGLVKSIHLNDLKPFTMGDFVNLLGNPDMVDISLSDTPDGGTILSYLAFYPVRGISVWVLLGSSNGPSSDDYIKSMSIDTEIDTQNAQPWIGYGHLEEYLSRSYPPP